MKETRLFMILMLCFTVMSISMTSCLSDDDDDQNTTRVLTPAEKTAMITAMAGNYDGHIFFINDSTSSIDSIEVSCTLGLDSVFTIHDFPYRALSNGISLKSMSDIVNNAGEGHFSDVLHLFYNESSSQGFYTFWALPASEKELEKTFTYDGKEHVLKVTYSNQIVNTFVYNNEIYYPYGEYRDGKIVVYILIYSVVVDGDSRAVNRVLFFYGNK